MPLIRIEYDNNNVENADIQKLSEAVQKIVSETTNIEDVFVYANSAEIKVKIAPVEIFIQMSAHKIEDRDALTKELVSRISAWKKENNFNHPINFTLIPMDWKIEIDI
ncbi:MAG: hypothetical protein Q7S66_05680 [bacterium]|nr:hypothetical protein [bacterium]